MTRLAIHGAAGRMGQRLVALAQPDPRFTLAAALDHPEHPQLGEDVGALAGLGPMDLPLQSQLQPPVHAVIDFSVPQGTRRILDACCTHHAALVIGTTGLSDADHAAIDQAAQQIPILQAPNMSLGVNLLFQLAADVARRLGPDYDVEIVETHHNQKKDAPSGTAKGLAEAICQATDRSYETDVDHGRVGDDVPRQAGRIGMHALRLGEVIGRHDVYFAAAGEEIRIGHAASNRDVFVRGALTAAHWLATRQPGRYAMTDVLGL